jgi:hypothetical protein
MHLAYVEWAPEFEEEHTATFVTEHSHKKCAEKNPEIEVTLECDALLPPLIRHVLTDDTKDRVLTAARIWALSWVPVGTAFTVRYIGETTPPVPANPEGRYTFGRRDEWGRYPVYVDGALAGHVHRNRRTWYARGLDEKKSTDHKTRKEAAVRLVGLIDMRRKMG